MLAILSQSGDFVKITQDKPFYFVTGLTGWVQDITGTGVYKKEFRWGTTNRVRASWVLLTDENLQNVILNAENDLFVDFRITLISGSPITINSINVKYTQSADAKDPYLGFTPAMLVSENGNISNLTKIENFTFRPYAVNPAIVLYKNLAYTVNQMFGHDVMYARAVPMAVGRDVTLHEWTLYDVDDPKCIKVMVPKNEFPDSQISFNPMGLDFEMPFECHIVKEYYEELFGIGTGPQKRDIIYFPLTNRIYEIESSYLFKGIMQKEVYWKINLQKYAPKSNRYEPQDLREQLDIMSFDAEEQFGEEVELNSINLTDPQQFDPKIGSNKYDPIRLNINDSLIISNTKVENYSIILSETQYDLRSIYNAKLPTQLTAIEYKSAVNFPASDDKSLCMWFKELKPINTIYKDNLSYLTRGTVGAQTTQIIFRITADRKYTDGQFIKITRFNGLTLFGKIASRTLTNNYEEYVINVSNEIIAYLDVYYSGWTSSPTGAAAELINEQILFDGYRENKGWRLSVFASRYIVFKDAQKETINILPTNLVEDYWYAIFVNISNFYRQLTVDLWVRKWNELTPQPIATTELENIYSNTASITQIDRSNTTYNYTLVASNLAITNIRLFDKIETEQSKQSIILNQTISQDAEFATIIDNATQRLVLPWIGQTK